MSAYLTAAGWVIDTLTADPAIAAAVDGRVFEGIAPAKAAYPLIVVQAYVDAVDTTYLGVRAATTVDLTVRVVDRAPDSHGAGTVTRIVPVADRADVLLSDTHQHERTGGLVAGCTRVAETSFTEARDGATVRGIGGRYRIVVAPR